jgi:hypothetical protein
LLTHKQIFNDSISNTLEQFPHAPRCLSDLKIFELKALIQGGSDIMNHLLLTLTAAATVLASGSLVPSRVEASPLSASIGANLANEARGPIENVAICFYVDGWNGPGLYECGYRHRRGEGWHGRRDGDARHGHDVDRSRRGDRSDQTEGRGRR